MDGEVETAQPDYFRSTVSDNTPEMSIIQNGNNMNCPTNHANVKLHTKYNHNPYETEQRGECQDCGASLDVTDIPDDAEVRDEYGRLVDAPIKRVGNNV